MISFHFISFIAKYYLFQSHSFLHSTGHSLRFFQNFKVPTASTIWYIAYAYAFLHSKLFAYSTFINSQKSYNCHNGRKAKFYITRFLPAVSVFMYKMCNNHEIHMLNALLSTKVWSSYKIATN